MASIRRRRLVGIGEGGRKVERSSRLIYKERHTFRVLSAGAPIRREETGEGKGPHSRPFPLAILECLNYGGTQGPPGLP